MEKLARKQIQTLTPYMSARKIGGSGDVWLNANESPFNNEYKTDFARLNRYMSASLTSSFLPMPLMLG